jgi:3-hydroxybutyryl-CoA dehydrogenase
MGSRIALMLASSGGEVRIYDPNANQLEVARRYVEAELPRVVAGRSGSSRSFGSLEDRPSRRC